MRPSSSVILCTLIYYSLYCFGVINDDDDDDDDDDRPHYASCPFICLSVCPVRARNSKTKKRRKIKIGITFPRARLNGAPIFSWKGQWSLSPDVKNSRNCTHIWRTSCLFTGGGSITGGSGADCKIGLTIVRPNLLSTRGVHGSGKSHGNGNSHMAHNRNGNGNNAAGMGIAYF